MDRTQRTVTEDEARTLLRCFPDCTAIRETYDPSDVIDELPRFGTVGAWVDGQLDAEDSWFSHELDSLLACGADEARERAAHAVRMQQARDALRALDLLSIDMSGDRDAWGY